MRGIGQPVAAGIHDRVPIRPGEGVPFGGRRTRSVPGQARGARYDSTMTNHLHCTDCTAQGDNHRVEAGNQHCDQGPARGVPDQRATPIGGGV